MPDPLSLTPDIAELAAALQGQYTFEGEIGRGGMGVVYRARDMKLDRAVAVKVLPPYFERDADVRERFLREARTAASLAHPNIVPIYRADELGGHVFFAMAYVDGESLGERVRSRGPLPLKDAIPLLEDVARALDYAHQHSVIHRDVKAENILIDGATGHAMITDFGIARIAAAASMTATGQLLGTVWYMSPEQVMGHPIDGRADLYALGVVAFFALSGHYPFEYDAPAAVLVAHATKAAPPLAALAPRVPPGIAAVIDRLLAKDPAARYRTGAELVEALETAQRAPATAVPEYQAPPLPPVLSDDEAQALWKRAAELQAATGRVNVPGALPALQAPPAPPGAPPTSGYRIGDVLGAATEAGIGDEFVARAAAELGLVSGPLAASVLSPSSARVASPPGITVTSPTEQRRHPFRGAPGVIEYEARVDGEMSERDLEMAVEIIRRTMKQVGVVSRIGRSLSWSAVGDERKVDVTVTARGGRTVIRAYERLGTLAGGLFGGIVGGAGGTGFGVSMGVGLSTFHNPAAAILLALSAVGGSYSLARAIYVSVAHDRQSQLRRLVGELAEFARDGIEPGLPTPSTPGAPRLPPDVRTPGVRR